MATTIAEGTSSGEHSTSTARATTAERWLTTKRSGLTCVHHDGLVELHDQLLRVVRHPARPAVSAASGSALPPPAGRPGGQAGRAKRHGLLRGAAADHAELQDLLHFFPTGETWGNDALPPVITQLHPKKGVRRRRRRMLDGSVPSGFPRWAAAAVALLVCSQLCSVLATSLLALLLASAEVAGVTRFIRPALRCRRRSCWAWRLEHPSSSTTLGAGGACRL
jgi:hypothetical protein